MKYTFNFSVKTLYVAIIFFFSVVSKAQEISLTGNWKFAIDRMDKGIEEKWFNNTLEGNIQLPGSMAENGWGDEVTLQTQWTGSIYDSSYFFRPGLDKYRQPDNIKIPFWLTPVKHYTGVAWYQKKIKLHEKWKNKSIELFLERCHIQTRVWINGKEIGKSNSLVAAHRYTLPQNIAPGNHTITIRVDNRLKEVNVGPDSHSVSDHTQGNWNGIVGKILLKAQPTLYIDAIQVYPDIKHQQARVIISIVNTGSKAVTGRLVLRAESFNTPMRHVVPSITITTKNNAHDTLFTEATVFLGKKMQLWDEFHPALYRFTVKFQSPAGIHTKQTSSGMREIKSVGNQLQLNSKTIHLRGDLNNCEFPLTGYAPMDVESWEQIYKTAKLHGLNHFRFHSWCPPEAAFIAADKTGFYLQPEGPTWPNHGTSLGDNRFIDTYLHEETARIMRDYGNHPSFCFFAAGNEPAGKNQAKYLNEFVSYWRSKDNRRLYTGAAVAMSWPLYPESDYMIKSGPRGLHWDKNRPETISDFYTTIEAFKMPYITHENGQWCVFPDFKEINSYKGVMRARNFEMFRDELKERGMLEKAEDFLMASGKLQALMYKHELEKSFRTKNSAGFQLLGLQDFPGQGSAVIGVLNAFWKEKGYITAKQWSRFCNTTVPLSRIPKFTYCNNEVFNAAIEIYHYGATDINTTISWFIKDINGHILQKGHFKNINIPTGGNTIAGNIIVPLSTITQATKLNLEVVIEGSSFANDWNFWVYPQTLTELTLPGIHYTDTLDTAAEKVLLQGGTVFLNAAGKVVKGKEVVQYFTPVFWNTSWFKMRPPHTLGIWVDTASSAFHFFPTEYHSNMQWWEIVNKAQVMHLEDFPEGFTPLVQPIDTWFINRKLALLLEAKVGKGKIIICSADLSFGPEERIVARQLMYSLNRYMVSGNFNPKYQVSLPVLKDLFVTPSKLIWDSYTNATPDELKPQHQLK